MKKSFVFLNFLLIFAFALSLFCPCPTFSHALTQGEAAKVIVSNCYLYTEADFSSNRVSYFDGENNVFVMLKHGDQVNVKEISGDFVLVDNQEGKEGYVYKYYLSNNTSQSVYPVFNATVRKNTTIYDLEKSPTEFTAKKGARAYIYQGFNDKEKYTAVQIVLEDESLYNGYILTSDIAPDGVNGLLIVAISIIIAAVTIVLSLVFIKKKGKKQKEK